MLSEDPEESETSYNFGQQLSYVESQNLEFQKMFAKIGGENWKGADVAKTLSQYMSILDFGLNSPKKYGKKEDNPVWWQKKPKWKNFRNPSKVSKDECTAIIKLLLEHYGIDPEIHYVNFPDEESEESSDSSSEEEDAGNRDDEEEEDDGDEEEDSSEEEENGNKRARNISLAKTAEEVNRVSTACTEGNIYLEERAERMREMEEEYSRYKAEEKGNRKELTKTRKNYVELNKQKKRKK